MNSTSYVCEAMIGTTVTLNCQFISVPAGSLVIDIPIFQSNVEFIQPVITIEDVTEDNHQDMIKCSASNIVADDTMSEVINIRIGMYLYRYVRIIM